MIWTLMSHFERITIQNKQTFFGNSFFKKSRKDTCEKTEIIFDQELESTNVFCSYSYEALRYKTSQFRVTKSATRQILPSKKTLVPNCFWRNSPTKFRRPKVSDPPNYGLAQETKQKQTDIMIGPGKKPASNLSNAVGSGEYHKSLSHHSAFPLTKSAKNKLLTKQFHSKLLFRTVFID